MPSFSILTSLHRILVLSDGQIVEQGTHKELLERPGIFAKMWADQVHADRLAKSLSGAQESSGLGLFVESASTHIAIAGYDTGHVVVPESRAPENVEVAETTLHAGTLVDEPEGVGENTRASVTAVEAADKTSIAPEQQEEKQKAMEGSVKQMDEPETTSKTYAEVITSEPEVSLQEDSSVGALEASAAPGSAPVAFPSGGDDAGSSKPASVSATPSGGITFSPEVNSPPSRSGTPDPDAGPKRKRISSQNFQRLAKKITMVRRNSSSASIDPEASTSSLESPGATAKPKKSKLRRKSTAPPADKPVDK